MLLQMHQEHAILIARLLLGGLWKGQRNYIASEAKLTHLMSVSWPGHEKQQAGKATMERCALVQCQIGDETFVQLALAQLPALLWYLLLALMVENQTKYFLKGFWEPWGFCCVTVFRSFVIDGCNYMLVSDRQAWLSRVNPKILNMLQDMVDNWFIPPVQNHQQYNTCTKVHTKNHKRWVCSC